MILMECKRLAEVDFPIAVVPQAPCFWESCSLDELARCQGVSLPTAIEEMLGGWPDDEINDGFEHVVASGRERELE